MILKLVIKEKYIGDYILENLYLTTTNSMRSYKKY
jgi:hypothetical protein